MVNRVSLYGKNAIEAWQQFIKRAQLTDKQTEQFEHYAVELLAWNEKFNITAITDMATLIADHFQDSLALAPHVSWQPTDMVCDVGSGGGFPGIPLKIMFPHVPMVLLEVNQKKVQFLNAMIQELGLENITVCDADWRTYIRQASDPITCFIARASLKPDELLRIFKPSSAYQKAMLVYWASKTWQPSEKEKSFIDKEITYTVEHKERRLILFRHKQQ